MPKSPAALMAAMTTSSPYFYTSHQHADIIIHNISQNNTYIQGAAKKMTQHLKCDNSVTL